MLRNKNNNIHSIIQVGLSIILIAIITQLILFESIKINYVSARSSWTQNSDSDFNNGTLDNIVVTIDDNIKLGLQMKYIEDDFIDESQISYKKNIVVDTDAGEAKLLKIVRTFGGSNMDYGESIQQTSDSGYIITGWTESYGAGGADMWLIKTNSQGIIKWTKTFGGFSDDYSNSVQQTLDGGFIIAGHTESFGAGLNDFWLIKTDTFGNKQWDKTFGGISYETSYSVQQTTDGGYIITGSTMSYGAGGSDVWLIKTNSQGIMEWNKTFGGSSSEYGFSGHQTSDNGYIITGFTDSYGNGGSDVWLIKTNSSGNKQWDKTFGGSEFEWGYSTQQTSDNGYIITGFTNSYGAGDEDIWLIKTNASGIEQWNKTYGGSKSDSGKSVQQASDGGYIITGYTYPSGAESSDLWLIKTNSTGANQWNKTFGGFNSEFGECVQQASDGGYIITGYTESYGNNGDVWLIRTDSLGNVQFTNGDLISTNLLSGQYEYFIDKFKCRVRIPQETGIKVQFSQDNHSWFNSTGVVDAWDLLTTGFNSIDLTSLALQNSNFFYRMNFTSDSIKIPALQNINISLSQYVSFGTLTSQSFDVENKNIKWKTLNWTANTPIGTHIKFQLRTADTQFNLSFKNFVGLDGTTSTYYTTSGQMVWTGHDGGRWIQYKVHLSTKNKIETPALYKVIIFYNYLPNAPILIAPNNSSWTNNNMPIFTWIFSDSDSSSQCGYQWQADDANDFSSVNYNSKKIFSNKSSYIPSKPINDGIWFWRIRTQDNDGDWGPFSNYGILKIDTSINKPIGVTVNPINWTSNNLFTIDWETPSDMSGIINGTYYYISNGPPTSQSNGTWTSNKSFTITNTQEGENNIYIWLEDNAKNKNYLDYISAALKLDATPPKIKHIPFIKGTEGSEINITVEVIDKHSGVNEVVLYFKGQKNITYTKLLMKYNGYNYSALIPKNAVKLDGLEYYIKSSDRSSPSNIKYYGYYGEILIEPTSMTDIDIAISPLPVIINTTPIGIDVPIETTINITFNKPMEEIVTENAFSILPTISGVLSWNDNELIFEPDKPLDYNTTYTVSISKSTKDLEGNNLENDFQWSFNTIKNDEDHDLNNNKPSTTNEPEKKKIQDDIIWVYIMVIVNIILMIILGLLLFMLLRKEKTTKADEKKKEKIT